MTYGWTIPEVDEVEMPMIMTLLEQIGEMPSADLLANAQQKAAIESARREQQAAMSGLQIKKGRVRRK
jgi:hypothetical protein